MSKVLDVAGKSLKEAIRQPKNLAITLGLPVAFMLIFGLAFGSNDPTTYELAVVDADGSGMSRTFLDGIADLAYDDGTPMFTIERVASEAAAREALRNGDHDALLLIPRGFEAQAVGVAPDPGTPLPTDDQPGRPPEGATARVLGDPARPEHQAAAQIVAAYAAAFAEEVSGQKPAVSTQREAVTASELTAFDVIAPGLMIFAILNMVPQAASMLARETESKTLDRIRMSPTGAASLLGGVLLAQLALACVSLALMLGTARLMGFHNQGSYAHAYVIALVAALAVTGIGMIVAAFARTQQEAANFGILVSVPSSFLSGAFFAIPAFSLAGWNVYEALPTTHAVEALRQIMTFGQSVDAVRDALATLMILSVAYFAAGMWLYRRTRLRAD